jgi:hypothetical protein
MSGLEKKQINYSDVRKALCSMGRIASENVKMMAAMARDSLAAVRHLQRQSKGVSDETLRRIFK